MYIHITCPYINCETVQSVIVITRCLNKRVSERDEKSSMNGQKTCKLKSEFYHELIEVISENNYEQFLIKLVTSCHSY